MSLLMASSFKALFLVSAFVFSALLSNQTATAFGNIATYDNYRVYRIHLTNAEQVETFNQLNLGSDSFTFLGHARNVGQRLTILVAAHKIADFHELLERFAVEHAILTYNFQDAINEQFRSVQPPTTPGRQMDWMHYYHLDTIYDWMDSLIADNPDRVQPIELGNSYESRRIRGVKVSAGPASPHHQRTGIFIEAGIHAREWISPAVGTFILDQLLHSNEPHIRRMASTFDWYIVPVLNPDGYAFTFGGDRMWRKTRKPNGVCVGTDLNRNFEAHWRSIGSSADPCAEDFTGPAAASEPESAQLSAWLRAHRNGARIETYIALHSFSQMLMFPYGYTDRKPGNYADLLRIGQAAVRAAAKRYGTPYQTGSGHDIIYPTSGGSVDWAFDELHVPIAFTMELRGAAESAALFNLPAAEIVPVGEELLDGLAAMLDEAKGLGYYEISCAD